jgi:hypothetical protein
VSTIFVAAINHHANDGTAIQSVGEDSRADSCSNRIDALIRVVPTLVGFGRVFCAQMCRREPIPSRVERPNRCGPAAQQRKTAAMSIDRTQISSASRTLLSVHLKDGLAVLTRCVSTKPEHTNGKKDKEQAERVHERGCEAAQGSF